MRRINLSALLVLVSLALLVNAVAAQPRFGREIKSEHYAIHTDLPEWAAKQTAEYMDWLFAAFEQRFKGYPVKNNAPPVLYLFAQREDYVTFARARGASTAAHSAGTFFHARGGQESALAAFVQFDDRETTFRVLRHEATHQFVQERLGLQVPTWLNEGVAEYFEDGIVGKDQILTGLLRPEKLERVQAAVRQNAHMPFVQMLAIGGRDWHAILPHQDLGTLIYAQVWSVVHFLIHAEDGKYVEAFTEYFKRVGNGQNSIEAFLQAFQVDDPAQVEEAWKEYILAATPDAISLARGELHWLTQGLGKLHQAGVNPKNSQELYAALRNARLPHVGMERSVFAVRNGPSLRVSPPTSRELPPELIVSSGQGSIRAWWFINQDGVPESEIIAEQSSTEE